LKLEINIAPLRCRNCGSELPARGQFITFQCPSCKRHWLIGEDGLEPLHVKRAIDKKVDGEPVYLPFWVVTIDVDSLVMGVKREMQKSTSKVSYTLEKIIDGDMDTKNTTEEEELLTINNTTEERLFTERGELIAQIATHEVSISRSELNHFIQKLSSKKGFRVFVPAFLSCNPYAYIKVGKLMTAHQIVYTAADSKSESQALCALKKSTALKLVDFIFISTLPERLQLAGKFVEKLHLVPVGEPSLVEFPFKVDGNYLTSVHGGFSISRKLISLTREAVTV